MEQETHNESVRPLLLLLAFDATKLVSQIVLRFICLPACAPLLFKLLTLPIINTEMDPWIEDRVATCGGTSHMIATLLKK